MTTRARTEGRYDLAFVREVLEAYDRTGNGYGTAKLYEVRSPSTVARWVARRERLGQDWPNLEDIEAKRTQDAARATQRAAHREWDSEYRKRCYFAGGRVQVPSIGTTRRLRALCSLGWTQINLADELGLSHQRVNHLVRGRFEYLQPRTVEAVRRVYDKLSMVVPIDPPVTKPRGQRPHEKVRRYARRMGWAPPLAWDEEDLDNPRARPKWGETTARRRVEVDPMIVERVLLGEDITETTSSEKREIMRRWLADGRSERSLCERMGWRHGRYTPAPTETETEESA